LSQQLNIPSSSFKFTRFDAVNLKEIYNILSTDELAVDLADGKAGFYEVTLLENCVHFHWRDIVPVDIDVLQEGQVKKVTYTRVEDAFFAIFKKFAISCGKPQPAKIGEFTVTKAVGVEFRSAHIAPNKLMDLSDHMTRIRGIDFEKLNHPVYRSVKLNGQIESLADIHPFHDFVENVKSIKGIMNTPDGVRTIKMSTDGKIGVTKKKEEDLSEEFFIWLHRLIYSAS
jgi:hypothetical protein